MSEWKEYKLEEISEIRREGFVPSTNEVLPYIGLEHIEPKSLRINSIGSSQDVTSQKSKFYVGDILYGKLRPYFQKVYYPRINGVCSTDIFVIRPREGINNKFLFYLLATDEFTSLANLGSTGTRMPRADWKHLSKTIWNIPDLPTQTAIAEILSSLDDKIELNNKINQELEALAQTLFKQWFVDFEFPNENGEPYKSSGGEMVDSELGEIPKGWEVKTLKDEFDINMGQSPKGESYNTNGDGLIFFQGRSDFGFRYPSIRMYTSDPKKIAKKFETLISVRAPVGDINMASEDCCIGRGLGSISHPSKLYSYTYYKILSIQDELKSYDNEGTVFGSINKETLGNIKCVTPPVDIVKSFNDLSVANDALIFNTANECQELVKTRDTLLPKLISGELEINEISN
jgi:type I restriction enzyme S subunit